MLGRNLPQVNAAETPFQLYRGLAGCYPCPHSGVRCPLPLHQRRSHAIPTTETRAVARGMGSGKCRLDGGRWVINSMGRSPNATCLGCRRIFCRSRVCISSTSPGFPKSIMSSRVSTVANRDLGQFTGLSRGIHITIVQPGGGQADLGKVSAGALIGLSQLSIPTPSRASASHRCRRVPSWS
jgi:hypothetical protein